MTKLTRRDLLTGAACLGVALGTRFGTAPAHAGAGAPFPVAGDGRLVPHPLDAYGKAKLSGGPPKDGIPAIDNPIFWSAAEAEDYLDDADQVFGLVDRAGRARAYPQRILVWHEIVNDEIDGTSLAVTYCPLTGTALAFERGRTTFGVSGRLVNSNLIMFDRDSDTWFPQILGVAIEGPHAGAALVERPLVWTSWGRWRARHPDTEVLSSETGFARNYERDPYGSYNPLSGYYRPDAPTMFPVMHRDRRLAPKSVVLGARTATEAVAFAKPALRDAGQLVLEAADGVFVAVYDQELDTGYIFAAAQAPAGAARVEGTGPDAVRWPEGVAAQPLDAFEAMWFAWAAFYPETRFHG